MPVVFTARESFSCFDKFASRSEERECSACKNYGRTIILFFLILACILDSSSQIWILDPWSYHRNAIQCSPFSFPSYSSVLAPVLGSSLSRCANRLEQVASSPTLPMGCPRHLAAELPVHLDQALPTSYLCSWTNLWRSLWRSRKIFKDNLWKSLITNPTHRRNIMLLDIETRERNPNGIGLLPGEKIR